METPSRYPVRVSIDMLEITSDSIELAKKHGVTLFVPMLQTTNACLDVEIVGYIENIRSYLKDFMTGSDADIEDYIAAYSH